MKLLPWKVENVVIPTQYLSSGSFVVEPIGAGPLGAAIKLILFSTILLYLMKTLH